MNVEQPNRAPEVAAAAETADELSERQTAWNIWRFQSGGEDRNHFFHAYLGRYDDHAAFGEYLLRDHYNAQDRLSALPPWLRSYVRLDGDAFARSFERAGHYRIVEVPDGGGVYVFDRHGLDSAEGSSVRPLS